MMLKLLLTLLTGALFIVPTLAQDDPLAPGRELAGEGAFEEAIAFYDLYLDENPNNAEAYGLRGLAFAALGDDVTALDDLNAALEVADEELTPRLLVLRAEIHVRLRAIDSALADYDAAIDLDPTYALAYYNRGIIFDALADLDQALADYTAALELLPEQAAIFLRRARIHTLQENTQAALDDYTVAIDLQPDESQPYILRGHIHTESGDIQAAAADYAQWLYHTEAQRERHAPILQTRDRRLLMRFGTLHEFSFAGLAGQRLRVTATSNSVDSMLVVLGPDGDAIIADDDSGQGLNAAITAFVLPETGEYTLLVGHARGGWDGVVWLSFALSEII